MMSHDEVVSLNAELEHIENKIEHAYACLLEGEYQEARRYLKQALCYLATTMTKEREPCKCAKC